MARLDHLDWAKVPSVPVFGDYKSVSNPLAKALKKLADKPARGLAGAAEMDAVMA
jgi:hypothetical protein